MYVHTIVCIYYIYVYTIVCIYYSMYIVCIYYIYIYILYIYIHTIYIYIHTIVCDSMCIMYIYQLVMLEMWIQHDLTAI